MGAVVISSFETGDVMFDVNRMMAFPGGNDFLHIGMRVGSPHSEMERACISGNNLPLGIGWIAMWWAVFLTAEGQAKEIATQHGEQRGKTRKLRRLPRGKRVRRNIAPGMVEHDRCKVPAAKGDREVKLRTC